MPTQIDSLEITIQAKNDQAIASIEKLVDALTILDQKLKSVKTSGYTKEIDKMSKALTKTTASISKTGVGMEKMSAETAKAGSALRSFPSATTGLISSLGKAVKNSLNLAATFGKLYASFWILRRLFAKGLQIIDIASDLTEVQNVVDVTFGRMAYKLDEFAQTSRQKFGLSELSLKTYASQFQAMFKAMGLSASQVAEVHTRLADNTDYATYAMSKGYELLTKDISDMSLNLTKLAADMGSFFNQNPEDVAKRLQAGVVSGQSRALRAYGVDLTMATLQEYALSKGIEADIQSMTQAEKTMLRYQYVMEAMSMTMGDFQRTSTTWANTVKLLKQNFEALGAVIGTALIGWIKPAIIAINNAMNTIIALVQKAVNAIGKLMGWQIEISSIGAGLGEDADALDSAADSADDVAGGLGKAGKEADKLKKTILGFDELNVLNDNNEKDKSGSGGGGAGGGDLFGGLTDSLIGEISGANLRKYESDIDNWFELGSRISDTIRKSLAKIDWEGEVFPSARRFGRSFADFLNGLITPDLFGEIGETIANALNTKLEVLNSFGTRFDWKGLGTSIGVGINRFFSTYRFEELADTINKFAHGVLDTFIRAIEQTDWDLIGERIGTFLTKIDFMGIGRKIGKLIWTAINAGFKAFKKSFEVAPFETALLSLAGLTKLLKVKAITDFGVALTIAGGHFNDFIRAIRNHSGVFDTFTAAFPRATGVIEKLQGAYSTFHIALKKGSGLFGSVSAGFEKMRGSISPFGKALTGVAATVGEFLVFKNVIPDILEGTGNLGVKIGELAVAFGAAGIAFSAVFGFPLGIVAAGITAAVGAFVGLRETVEKEVDTSAWNAIGGALVQPGGTPIEDIANKYSELFDGISSGFGSVVEASKGLEDAKQELNGTVEHIDKIAFAMDHGAIVTESRIAEIEEQFNNLLQESTNVFDKEYDVIVAGVAGALGEAAEAAGISVDSIIGSLSKLQSEHEQAVSDIKRQQEELKRQYDQGEIDQSEYYTGMINYAKQLADLNGDVDKYAQAISELNDVTGQVDFSSLVQSVEGVYSIDMSGLSAQISQVSDSYRDANKTITESSTEMQTAIDDYIKYAQSVNDQESVSVLKGLAEAETTNAETAKQSLQDGIDEYAKTVQDGVLNKIPSVIDEALKDYENLSPLAKLFTSETEYVETAIQKYQTEVIDPTCKGLQEMYDDLGIEGSTYASDAAKTIAESAFDIDTTTLAEGVQVSEKKLKDNWHDVITGTAEEVEGDAETIGKAVVDGGNTGIENNISTSEQPVKHWWDFITKIFKREAEIGSPSKVSAEWGKYVVEGMNNGIADNTESSETSVAGWVSAISDKMLTDLNTMLTKTKGDMDTGLTDTAETAHTKLTDMQGDMSKVYGDISTDTADKFKNIFDTISSKMNDAKEHVATAIDGIGRIFSGAHFQLPEIKLPHFSWYQEDTGFGFSLPRISVDWYAKGGFPEDGLFMANHGELVGQFSNGRTAVANNEQIISGIQGGVTRAIINYLPDIIRDAVSAADTGGGDLYIGDDVIYRASERGRRSADKRYNPSMQF